MAKTYTEQAHPPPPSSNSLTADGEGMHSLIPFDLIRDINNLATYVNPHLHYVQGSGGLSNSVAAADGTLRVQYVAAASERFACQIPVYVPLWATRMLWTVGVKCVASTVSAVHVYASQTPYFGNHGDVGVFSTAGLDANYQTRSVSLSLTAGNYGLADDSTTGITSPSLFSGLLAVAGGVHGLKRKTYAIVTVSAGNNATFDVADCSFWFVPT